jgi:hypothetical protein
MRDVDHGAGNGQVMQAQIISCSVLSRWADFRLGDSWALASSAARSRFTGPICSVVLAAQGRLPLTSQQGGERHGQWQGECRFHLKKGTINAPWLGGSGSAAIAPSSGTLRTKLRQ